MTKKSSNCIMYGGKAINHVKIKRGKSAQKQYKNEYVWVEKKFIRHYISNWDFDHAKYCLCPYKNMKSLLHSQ